MNSGPDMSEFGKVIDDAFSKLFFKVLAFSEAYIFVLEGSAIAGRRLQAISESKRVDESLKVDPKTIEASYSRLNRILDRHGMELNEYFRSVLFVDLVSSTEIFFTEMIQSVVIKYPQKLGRIQFDLQDIIEASNQSEIILRASEQYINALMYERPESFLVKMCDILSIDLSAIKQYWPIYIEAKARRDIGVHNNWICNKTYISKVRSFQDCDDIKEGMVLYPSDREYCAAVSENIRQLCFQMAELVKEKYSES